MKKSIFNKLKKVTEEIYKNKLNFHEILKLNSTIKIKKEDKFKLNEEKLSKKELLELGFGEWDNYMLVPIWFLPYLHPKTLGVKVGSGSSDLVELKRISEYDHIMSRLNFGFKV